MENTVRLFKMQPLFMSILSTPSGILTTKLAVIGRFGTTIIKSGSQKAKRSLRNVSTRSRSVEEPVEV